MANLMSFLRLIGYSHNILGKFPIFTLKLDGVGRKSVYLYKRISPFPLKSENAAVKIDGGRGSQHLSLQCKDRKIPQNFDVIP